MAVGFVKPHEQLLHWQFRQTFLYSPAQSMNRFAHRCATEIVQSRNDLQNIDPVVDGIDYDPDELNIKMRPLPFVTWTGERVAFNFYGHTFNYAMATEDINALLPSFRRLIGMKARESWERFLDRIMAGYCDGGRVKVTGAARGYLADQSRSKANLPDANKFFHTELSGSNYVPAPINVSLFKHMLTTMYANELMDPRTGLQAMPVCVVRAEGAFGLLDDNIYTSRDYNTTLPLVRGDVNSYMGFEIIKTAMIDAVGIPKAAIRGTLAAVNAGDRNKVFAAPSTGSATGWTNPTTLASGYTEIKGGDKGAAGANIGKALFCYPHMAFAKGILPNAGYTQMWQNPNRGGTLEWYMKQVLSYRRNQNDFVRVAYYKRDIDSAAVAARHQAQTDLESHYQTTAARSSVSNTDASAGWSFAQNGPGF